MQRLSGRKCFFGFLVVALSYIIITGVVVHLTKNSNLNELAENQAWIASGKYWLDRQVCRWLGLCGVQNYVYTSGWTWDTEEGDVPPPDLEDDVKDWWQSGSEDPDQWSKHERKLREIPQYVLDHAPYVHLFSGEQYWPSDLGEHLTHTSPYHNYTKILDIDDKRNLTDLNELNKYGKGEHGRFMYLHSDDNVEDKPEWLASEENIPSIPEKDDEDWDGDHPWPDLDDLEDFDLESAKQQALKDFVKSAGKDDSASEYSTDLKVSQDGRCGGSSSFTCKGSNFGQCCSIYGWCGKGDDYCGDPCDPLSGTCYDPYNPPTGPHTDLRRRGLDLHGRQHRPHSGGRSSAPAVLVVVPKEDGIVDAFWFFFYSYNLGQRVLNIRFGNHVGDWEHTTIRFKNGKPYEVFLSEHDFGSAFTWKAMEKYIPSFDGSGTMIGSWSNETAARHAKRPVVYSAVGSHAMYGTPGLHPYVLPGGILHDETDRGPLWDPAQNLQSYTYDPKSHKVRASTLNPTSPTEWFDFAGHWGDKYYPLSDPRQYRFAGQYHYVNGPTGPKFKNLGRKNVCQGIGKCDVRHWLGGKLPVSHEPPEEDIEDGYLPGGNSTEEA